MRSSNHIIPRAYREEEMEDERRTRTIVIVSVNR